MYFAIGIEKNQVSAYFSVFSQRGMRQISEESKTKPSKYQILILERGTENTHHSLVHLLEKMLIPSFISEGFFSQLLYLLQSSYKDLTLEYIAAMFVCMLFS
jgi:hypothetical protein